MLTRLHIDNFRCLVNFEHRPARKQLILGPNGSGKSSLLDALSLLRQIVVRSSVLDDLLLLSQRARWLNQREQTWELEAALGGGTYVYRLVVEPWGEPPRPRVASETVHFNGKPIFEFLSGEVHLYNQGLGSKVTYQFDRNRSAFATIIPRSDEQGISTFKQWLGNLFCFRLNPFAMGSRAEREDFYPDADLSNVAAWYRHLVQANPRQNAALLNSLRESLEGFSFLQLEPAGENVRVLAAEFARNNEKHVKFNFSELSDGQRCLICLHTILHFVLSEGGTVSTSRTIFCRSARFSRG